MKSACFAAALLLCAPSAPTSAADLTAVVPADAALVVVAPDTPKLVEQWTETPLARMWEDPQIQRFFAPLRDDLDMDLWNEEVEEETGYSLDELMAFFAGQTVFFMPKLEGKPGEADSSIDGSGEADRPMVLLAHIGDRAEDFEQLLLSQEEKSADLTPDSGESREITTAVREFQGVEMHIDQVETENGIEDLDCWAVFSETFATATSPRLLEAVIAAIEDGQTTTGLADSDNFQTVTDNVAGSALYLYGDLEQIVPVVRAEMVAEAAQGDQIAALFPPEVTFDALALDVLQAGYATLRLDGGVIDLEGGVTFTDSRGLVKLLAYQPGKVPQPAIIPGDATSFGAAAFDFSSAWEAVEEIVNAMNPIILATFAAQIQAAGDNAGVELDLRRDLLGNLGTEVFYAESPLAAASADEDLPLGRQSQVIGVAIKQREGFEMALETLKGMIGQGSEPFQTREYLGTQIHSFATPGVTPATSADTGFAYALTDRHLLIAAAGSSALESVLVAMNNPGASIWQRPGVRSALAALPGGAAGLQYQDLAASGNSLFEALAFFSSTTDDEDLVICDPAALPDEETLARYLGSGVTGIYRDGTSTAMRLRFMPAEHGNE